MLCCKNLSENKGAKQLPFLSDSFIHSITYASDTIDTLISNTVLAVTLLDKYDSFQSKHAFTTLCKIPEYL